MVGTSCSGVLPISWDTRELGCHENVPRRGNPVLVESAQAPGAEAANELAEVWPHSPTLDPKARSHASSSKCAL